MNNFKTVLISSSQITKHANHYLGSLLKEKKGYNVSLIIPNISHFDKTFYVEKYASYVDKIYQVPDEFDLLKININERKLVNKIKKFEFFYQTSLNNIFFNNRIIGAGFFANGGVNQPKFALRENTSYLDILKIALGYLVFWDDILKQKDVKLALNLPDHAHILAKKRNIISERIIPGKFNNTQYWSGNYYMQPDNLQKNFVSIRRFKIINLNKPYDSYLRVRKLDISNFSLKSTLLNSVLSIPKNIRGKLKGYKKSKSIFIIDQFLSYWKNRFAFKHCMKISTINSSQIKKLKYVYFPLITEPEVALQGIARDFFFQLSALNLLSKELPSDYCIIVKEHLLAMGRRPRDFYKQILAHKNVKFANPLDFGLAYIKNSKAVAGITGTALWEAAVLGIPVISFSKNNSFNFLEHVSYVKNQETLKRIISSLEKIKLPNKKFTKEGSKLYHAYHKCSFDLGKIEEFISWKISKDVKGQSFAKLAFKNLCKKINI